MSLQRGQDRQGIWSQDDTLPDMPLPEFAVLELQREEDYLRNLLASPEYRAIEVDYREFRRTHNRKKPSWYQLAARPRTPGQPIPTNIEELARWLKMAQQYDKLLRYWVSLAHAYEVRRFFDKGAVEIRQLGRYAKPRRYAW